MPKDKKSLSSKFLYPDLAYDSIHDIELNSLFVGGIKGLIVDIDNTLIAPGMKKPDERMNKWIETARDAGFDICLLSNASRRRVARLASGFGIYAIARAGKPSRAGFIKAMRLLKLAPPQVCVIGDQIFTDVLGAKKMGIKAIYTKPITKREEINVFFKRFAEYFIMKGYNKTIGA